MTVEEMLHRISSKELSEWMAFYGLEPFGYVASMHGSAIVSSVIAEVNRNTEKRSEPFSAQEFLPKELDNEIESDVEQPSVFDKLKEALFGNNTGTSG